MKGKGIMTCRLMSMVTMYWTHTDEVEEKTGRMGESVLT